MADTPRDQSFSHLRTVAAADVAVVIGAGLEGLIAALTLGARGLRVSVFERESIPIGTTAGVHRTLLRYPNIRIIGCVEVVEIFGTADRRAVRGVRARLRGLHDAEFFADLVVDASGSPTGFADWGNAVGYARPEDFDAMTGDVLEMVMAR